MTGIVVIRAPNVMRVIHRAVLSFCIYERASGPTVLQWKHLGDTLLQGFDVDVLQDDDDETDYTKVAAQLFETVVSPGFCTQNVFWTWNAEKLAWGYTIAPLDLPLAVEAEVDVDLVGYGSLGR